MAIKADAKHVLVINDTIEIVHAFRALLESEGHRVPVDQSSTRDWTQKTADIRAFAPDGIVLEFVVGQEPFGWHLLQRLKMQRDLANIPCSIGTAAITPLNDRGPHLRTLGVEAIPKPFDTDHLLAALERTLQPAGPQDRSGTAVNRDQATARKRFADD